MKILTIRGKNLASLESFEVELESGPLEHVGIFAITGPTGAGKTTLLDTLCVALFDRTPRLSNMAGVPVGTADQEEGQRIRANDVRGLLRRGAGEGFAEVDFLGRDGRGYRARWSVHRSRRRASGKLQNSEISLTDLETKQVFAGKKKETLAAIEDRLGLSFEQFRRSALLAQNDFAAFLRADKEQRSDLLERMTGTEIYTKVSIAAFRRAADEAKSLSALQESADASAILEDDARAALVARRDALRISHKEQSNLQKEIEAAIRWFGDSRKAKTALGEAQETHANAKRSLAGLAATAERIAVVRQARDHRGVVNAVNESRAHANKAKAQHLQAAGEQEAAAEAVVAERAAVVKAQALVEVSRKRYVEAIDAERIKLGERMEALEAWLAEHAELASSGGTAPHFAELAPEALDELRPELEEAVTASKREADAARKLEGTLQEQRSRAKGKREELAKQVEACHLPDLRTRHTRLTRQQAAIHRLQATVSAGAEARQRQSAATEEAEVANEAIATLKTRSAELEKDEQTSAAALSEAQAAFDRMRLALDLSDHREHLAQGEHCPLCGSLEHPWRDNDATSKVVGEQEQRVEQLRAEQATHRAAHSEAIASLKAQEHVKGKAAAESARQAEAVANANTQAKEQQADELLANVELSLGEEALAKILRGLEEQSASLGEQLVAAEKLDAELRRATEVETTADARWTKASEARQEAELRHHDAVALFSACQGYRYRSRNAELARSRGALAVCETKREAAPQWVPESEHKAQLAAQESEQTAIKAGAAAHSKLKSCIARVTETESATQESEARLAQLLIKLESSNEELLEKLSVSDDWLKEAEESVGAANRLVADAGGALREREARCHELASTPPPTVSEAEATERHAELTIKLEALVEEGVQVSGELLADEEARKRRDQLGEKITSAMERVRIFRTLSELIGSADGKKFRVFAQSLTLESLLEGANTHLKELAPRYLLERVPGHDLDLQVIDRDLADEVRSVNSLSGGESFLISLALALGLSSLASKDVRVESLLVDEGFGSLDGDTLEVALSVLDSLQATGRKVGLISHVPGFAERIGAQVIVTPQGGGRSTVRVQGPMSYG